MKALEAENEKLRISLAGLEQSVARLQRQVADLKDDEAKAKEALRKHEVRLWAPCPARAVAILLSCVSGSEAGRDLLS